MNKKLFSILLMLCVALSSLELNAIEVILVQRDKASKWCFVDVKGKTYFENRYEGKPYDTDEGTFAVWEKDSTFSVYQFDKNNPRLIANKLKSVGNFSEGVMAVCRAKDMPIEIIDKNGKTLLTLDTICGRLITECWYCHQGRFVVQTIDENGNVKKGMVDLSGKPVVEPVFDELFSCPNEQYVGIKGSEIYITVGRGEYRTLKLLKDGHVNPVGEYIMAQASHGTLVIDRKTMKTIVTLPEGSYVNDICYGFVEYNDGKDGRCVYNMKTKKTLTYKSDAITLTKKGFLVRKPYEDGDTMDLYSYNGKFIRSTRWTGADRYNDFVIAFALDQDTWETRQFLLDENLKLLKDYSFTEISYSSFIWQGYEYAAHREMNANLVATIMINNLHSALVDKGVMVGNTIKDLTIDNGMICYVNGHSIICEVVKGDGDLVTTASISYSGFDESSYETVYSAICTKMDKLYKKVAEGVYEDNGVYYRVEKNCNITVSKDRKLGAKVIADYMVKHLRTSLVELCTQTSKRSETTISPDTSLYKFDGQEIVCSVQKKDGVITEAYLWYGKYETSNCVTLYKYDEETFAEYRTLYKEICLLMDKKYNKIAEGVYEKDGVQYTIRDNTFDSDEESSGHIYVSAGLENLLKKK